MPTAHGYRLSQRLCLFRLAIAVYAADLLTTVGILSELMEEDNSLSDDSVASVPLAAFARQRTRLGCSVIRATFPLPVRKAEMDLQCRPELSSTRCRRGGSRFVTVFRCWVNLHGYASGWWVSFLHKNFDDSQKPLDSFVIRGYSMLSYLTRTPVLPPRSTDCTQLYVVPAHAPPMVSARRPIVSSATQGPSCKMECAGISPSSVGT